MNKISNLTFKLTKKDQATEDWLEQESRNHKFVVLLFYRGKWDNNTWDYLSSFVEIAPRLREKGGELFIIVGKNKTEKKKLKKYLGEQFKVISDRKSHLAQKFHITTTKTTKTITKDESNISSILSSFSCTRSSSPALLETTDIPSLLDKELFEVKHPGVLVLSSRQNKKGEWVSKTTIKNQYEVRESFSPRGLRELLDLHFGKARKPLRSSV